MDTLISLTLVFCFSGWSIWDTWRKALRLSAVAGALPVLALRNSMDPTTFSWWTARGQTLAAAFLLHASLEMAYEALHTDVVDATLGAVAGLFLLLTCSVIQNALRCFFTGNTGAIAMYVVSVAVHCSIQGMMLGVSGQIRVLVAMCVQNVPECCAMMSSIMSRIDESRRKKGQVKEERWWVRMVWLTSVMMAHELQITATSLTQQHQLHYDIYQIKTIPGWVLGPAAGYILGMCVLDLIPEAVASARKHNVSVMRWLRDLAMCMGSITVMGFILKVPYSKF